MWSEVTEGENPDLEDEVDFCPRGSQTGPTILGHSISLD